MEQPVLTSWMRARGAAPGPLFVAVGRGGALGTGAISTEGLASVLRGVAKRAGVAEFSAHDLRRTFVTTLLDKEVGLETVGGLTRHEDVKTTRLYDKRGERALRQGLDKLPSPF